MATSPQATTPQSLDLRVFILVIAAIILVAGAVTGVQAITGDDTGSGEPVPTTEAETGALAPGADGIEDGGELHVETLMGDFVGLVALR